MITGGIDISVGGVAALVSMCCAVHLDFHNGNVFVDDTNKANGRGAYLKKDKDVILKAKDSKVLERHLEVKVPESIYDELISKI